MADQDGWRGDDDSQRSPIDQILGHVPPAPRTPSARARELVFRYQGAQFVLLLVGLIFAGIGTILTLALDWGLPSDLALTLSGKPAVGQVVSMHKNRNVTVNGVHPTVIRFRYGELTDESSTRDEDILQRAIVGADIPIEVSGSWARVKGTDRSMMGLWGLVILIFPGLGLTLAYAGVRSNRREIRAFTDGRPIVARVTSSGEDYSVTINGRHPYQIIWEFEIAGKTYDGSISAMNRTLMAELVDRKQIAVLYDPMDPDVNTVWVS